jgi:hypothetical protein
MADFSDWFGKAFGVVDVRADGGELAFPGVKHGVSVARASLLKFKGVPIDALAFVAKVDTSANAHLPPVNPGWDFCMLGLAGPDLDDPKSKLTLDTWNPPTTRISYQEWENELEANLLPTQEEIDLKIAPTLDRRRRLEGVIGFYDEAAKRFFWDFVRIFRVKDALKVAHDGSKDWMAYKFRPLFGNENLSQEGGGHGPPDRK